MATNFILLVLIAILVSQIIQNKKIARNFEKIEEAQKELLRRVDAERATELDM